MKVAIVGAGAAGLMSACMLPESISVTVFDGNAEVGKKLLLTGNGRCNLTNLVDPDKFLESIPCGAEFLSTTIHGFTPQDTIRFFESIGIETKQEDNNRVFPKSGGAKAVRQALYDFATSRGVRFELGVEITDIGKLRKEFDAVIIATGGLSFPATGSNGAGTAFAKQFGHNVVTTRPALCGLQFKTPTGFQGTSVTVSATIGDITEVGDMIFTKNGVSGPVIFKLTSKFLGQSVSGEALVIDFIPSIDKPSFNPSDKPFYAFRKYLPQNVANWLALRGDKPKDIKRIAIPIKDFEPIETATITRGGVDVSEINPRTMESKIVPNLYFVGEVLNADGLSGGFNLQIAFSTAVACARSLCDTIG